jgi:hypothetical protein
MVAIQRSDLHLFSRLVNRVFGQRPKILQVNLTPCTVGAELTMTDMTATVRMHIACQVQEKYVLPWELIRETGGLSDGMVELTYGGEKATREYNVTARYQVNGIPKQETYLVPECPDAVLPAIPEQLAENAETLLNCLADARRYIESNSPRYVLGCVALNGDNGTMTATDGRILVQFTGWTFPWKDIALVPASPIFAMKEFRELGKPEIGYQNEWTTVKCGNCTVQFKRPEGRYPKVQNVIPDETGMAAWITLSEKDTAFLLKTISDLPGNNYQEQPVTIEVKDGTVAIRGANSPDGPVTELKLTDSTCMGQEVMSVYNREYIKQLLKSGCRKIGLPRKNADPQKGDVPALTLGENRLVVLMSLTEEFAVRYSDNMTTVSSADFAATVQKSAVKQRSKSKTPATLESPEISTTKAIVPAPETSAQAIPRSKPAQSAAPTDMIKAAELLRNALRDAFIHSNSMVKLAKAEAREKRANQSRDAMRNRALKTMQDSLQLFKTLDT